MELRYPLVCSLTYSSPSNHAARSRPLSQLAFVKFPELSSAATISRCCKRSRLVGVTRSFLFTLRRQQVVAGLLPVDPWSPNVDSQSLASQLFAVSLLPYLGFLYHITKSETAPKLTLFGFYFLLVFVGATIPAGIYAKVHYGTSLSNVDWLHGGAEFFLTLTNLFIVLGLRQALRAQQRQEDCEKGVVEEEDTLGSAK